MTSTGKVDRGALPVPDSGRSVLANAYVAPRTLAEEQLAHIFGEVLGLERVGAHDNFFELGGHSLLAIRAVSRIREAFQLEIPLRAIFETPTIAGLGQLVHEDKLRGGVDETPGIVPVSLEAHTTTLLPGGELDLEDLFHEHRGEDATR